MDATGLRHRGMKHPENNESEIRTTTLAISGMSCGACVRHVTRALDGMSGVVHVHVDLATNEATVEHLPAFVDAPSLIAAVRDAGYTARVVNTVDDADIPRLPHASAACACGCRRSESRPAPIGG
jgi:copper chaperone CopZ